MYKVKRAVLHHRGYNTGFISAWMENISKVEKGTIVLKAVSFISFKFIANIMDECLFWRSKVTQTTCFLNKMSSRAKHKTSPILPNNHTSDNPTSTKAPWLRQTSGCVCVWCKLNSPAWGCFETPPCAQSCCSCNPDVGDIINLCATTLKGKKSATYNVKNKQLFKKSFWWVCFHFTEGPHTHSSFMRPQSGSVLKQA